MNQQPPPPLPVADVEPPKAPVAIARVSRELKVEDALLYLDQVKMEFSEKPYIYNEFLDIMKNFKAQSIGTPGVIERVKNLFKGYNKLILGFNTFLPEGEGYKIELTPEELAGDAKKVAPVVKTETSSYSSSFVAPTRQQIDSTFTNHAARMNQPGQTTNTEPLAGQPQQMQQAHAIHYVTKIRNRFSDQPDTYRQFLKILHTYQKEQKGIKEVLEQVSTLFADHSDLLMEFTYFLPDAVQEQAKERLHRAARESEARRHAKMAATRAAAGTKKVNPPGVVTSQPMTIGNVFRPQNPLSFGPGGNKDGMLINPSLKPVQGWANTGDSSSNLQGQETALSAANAKKRARADAKAPGPTGAIKGDPRSGKKQTLAHSLNDLESESQDGDLGRKQSETSASGKKVPRGSGRGGKGPSEGGGNMASTDVRNTQDRSMSTYHSSRSNGRDSHISMSAERRFFDTVKEVLVGSSRDNWVEFVKLLELFSADTISKTELLEMAGDLFVQASGNGVAGNELALEFKRLLANRSDYEAHKEDVWFAVPLSEIDFSQCRKCTPSYRALPKDYPKPKCSERSEEEAAVLNDQWVSIPIGSEESYSFKHMRKNQYEESLFKVEDERFEIDMIIDSNMNTIRVLEPLAEEIAQLRSMETRGVHASQEAGAEGENGTSKSPSSSSHINLSPRFTFQLDKRHLSTVNLNAISRIYGEAHGEEILELLRKNPVAAIPVILKRLRQKDVEWRAARVELNNGWKETVARNHFKSFDHRSFYFRQSDKKYLSTRHLVSEIVGVPTVGSAPMTAVPSSVLGAAPFSTTSASEGENNSTITTAAVSVELNNVGSAVPFSITTAAALSVLTENGMGRSHEDNLIAGMGLKMEEENANLLVGMAPQLLMNYSNASHVVHRDIYKIMCHAAENTLNNTSDKERLAALWRDLLRVFFNVPPHYLYSQLVPSVGSTASASSTMVGESLVVPVIVLDPSEAWLPSTRVLTLFGSGTIKTFRAEDSMYEVELAFGTAFLNPNVIYGAEQLSKQALSAIGVTTDPDTGKDRIFNGLVHSEPIPASTASSSKGKTTTPEAVPTTVQDPCKLFFGTQMCYIFLRLHHTLYIRLSIAHQLASEANAHYREQVKEGGAVNQSPRFAASHNHTSLLSFMDAEDTEAHVVHHHGVHGPGSGLSAADRSNPVYDTFFGHLLGLIEGNIDNARFEDLCRDLLGNKAYVLYTLDKIIAQGIKHLQAMANDDNVNKLVGLFVYHHHKGSQQQQGTVGTGVDPTLYRNHVSHILSHTMEDVYRFQLMTPHAGISSGVSQVGIQHLGILNPNHLPSLGGGGVGVTFLSEGVSVAVNNNLDDEEEEEEEEEDVMDVSLGGPGLSPPILQRQMSNMSAKSSLLSPNGRSMSMSRDDGELKAPKAVLSDGEDSGSESERDDEEEEEEEERDGPQSDGNKSDNGDDDQDAPPSPPKLLYSPRASRQQFMSTSS